MKNVDRFNKSLVDAHLLNKKISFNEEGFIFYTDRHGREWIYFPITQRFTQRNTQNIYTANNIKTFFDLIDKWELEKTNLLAKNKSERKTDKLICYKITYLHSKLKKVIVAYIDTAKSKEDARQEVIKSPECSNPIILSVEKVRDSEYKNFVTAFTSNYQDMLGLNNCDNN